jgi:hypothetical protein
MDRGMTCGLLRSRGRAQTVDRVARLQKEAFTGGSQLRGVINPAVAGSGGGCQWGAHVRRDAGGRRRLLSRLVLLATTSGLEGRRSGPGTRRSLLQGWELCVVGGFADGVGELFCELAAQAYRGGRRRTARSHRSLGV